MLQKWHTLTQKMNSLALVSNASVISGLSPSDCPLLSAWQLACCSLVLNGLIFLLATWICHLTSLCNFHSLVTVASAWLQVLTNLGNTVACFGWKHMANRLIWLSGCQVKQNASRRSPVMKLSKVISFSPQHNKETSSPADAWLTQWKIISLSWALACYYRCKARIVLFQLTSVHLLTG